MTTQKDHPEFETWEDHPAFTRFDDDLLPDDPPEGWVVYGQSGPFSTRQGPYYYRQDEDGNYWRGMRLRTRHCNGQGIAHGGLLMSFADQLFGYTAFMATKGPAVTVTMNSEFLSAARAGDWLEGYATVTRAARSVVYMRSEFSVGSRPVLTANAVFKRLRAGHKPSKRVTKL